jgi:hypothetical protein
MEIGRLKKLCVGLVGFAGLLVLSSPAAGAGTPLVREHQAVYNQLLEGSCARSSRLVVRGGHGSFDFHPVAPQVGGLLAEPTYEAGQEPVYQASVSAAEEVETDDGAALLYRFSPVESSCSKWALDEPQLHYSYKTAERVRVQLRSKILRATAAIIPKDVDDPHLRLLGNRVYPSVTCSSLGMGTCSGYVSIKTKRPLSFRGRRRRLTLVEHEAFTQLPPMFTRYLEAQLWPPSSIHFTSRQQEDKYAADIERAIFRKKVPVLVKVIYRDERGHRRVVRKNLLLVGPRHHAHCACIH